MGWLKGRQVNTATAVFNLAGSAQNRPNFLKTTVVSAVLAGSDSIANSLTSAYFNGPGAKLKRFHRWAINNYGDIGVPGLVKLRLKTALPSYIQDAIIEEVAYTDLVIMGIQMGGASYTFWAEQWMLENRPEDVSSGWTAGFEEETQEISIVFWDSTSVSFTPEGFGHSENYIYATYSYRLENGQLRVGMFIYQIGSGKPTLDALYEIESRPSEALLAPIPIRLDGEFISEGFRSDIYPLVKKAAKKATGGELSEIVDQISKSESLEDMDYIYLVFGASANTKNQAARRYIFDFLEELAIEEVGAEAEYQEWKAKNEEAEDDWAEWEGIITAYPTPPWEIEIAPPDGGTGAPEEQPIPPPTGAPSRPWRGIKIENPGGATNYDVRIIWTSLEVVFGSGLVKPDAEVGEVWFSIGDPDELKANPYFPNVPTEPDEVQLVWLYTQVSETSWKAVKIRGMIQETYVFGNYKEVITLAEQIVEFEDDAERESSFLFPIKYSIFAAMSPKDATQFGLECSYLQIHAYQIYIQRIYESPLFFVILIVIVITITAATGGLGGASVGVLGANAAVGAVLGLTGVAAIVAGAIANAIAAMIITRIITAGAQELLGKKVGSVVGALASVMTINGLSNLASSGAFVINFSSMSLADQIILATSSVSNATVSYLNAEIDEIRGASEDLAEDYKQSMKVISNLYAENIGYDRGVIDPLDFLDSAKESTETPQEFLERTLMTGSDIAELTMLMLSNFSDITLDLKNVR